MVVIDKIYLLHNGVNRGELFTEIWLVAESLIQYAAIQKKHPLICDECFALQVDKILFDPEDINIVPGEVYLKFDDKDNLIAIKYIDGKEEDHSWLYPNDSESFKRIPVIEGLTELGL